MYITNAAEEPDGECRDVRFWGRMAREDTCDKGDDVRGRVAYLFMIGILIFLIAVVFAVLGKGEYKPPPPKEEQGYAPQQTLF